MFKKYIQKDIIDPILEDVINKMVIKMVEIIILYLERIKKVFEDGEKIKG